MNSTTWTLVVNACLLEKREEITSFIQIDRHFSAGHLEAMLQDISELLGAEVLSRSSVHFSPQGASAALIVGQLEGQGNTTLFHLDKSHLACHTYFEQSEKSEWRSFRLELELSTCGDLPVEKVLARIAADYKFDIFLVDCQRRGFMRDRNGLLELVNPSDGSPEVDIKINGYQSRKKDGFCSGTLMIAEDLGNREDEWTRLLAKPSS